MEFWRLPVSGRCYPITCRELELRGIGSPPVTSRSPTACLQMVLLVREATRGGGRVDRRPGSACSANCFSRTRLFVGFHLMFRLGDMVIVMVEQQTGHHQSSPDHRHGDKGEGATPCPLTAATKARLKTKPKIIEPTKVIILGDQRIFISSPLN